MVKANVRVTYVVDNFIYLEAHLDNLEHHLERIEDDTWRPVYWYLRVSN